MMVLLNRAPGGCFHPSGGVGGLQNRGIKAVLQRLGTSCSCELDLSAFDMLHRHKDPTPLSSISEFRTHTMFQHC